MAQLTRKLLAVAFLAIGVAALCYAAKGEGQRPIGIVAALASFFAAGSLISKVGTLSSKLRPFIGRTVTVRVWGNKLPDGELFTVESVSAIGAGLHIYLRPHPDGAPMHLKIAQPRQPQVTESTLEIADAKYIQWAGRKIRREGDGSVPAFVMHSKD